MWILANYVNKIHTNALKSCKCATDKSSLIATSVRNLDNRYRFRSYAEVVNYLLKKFATEQAIPEFDAAIIWYMQPADMSSQQYADNLVAKLCEVADVYDERHVERCVYRRSRFVNLLYSQTSFRSEPRSGFYRHRVPSRIAVVYPE